MYSYLLLVALFACSLAENLDSAQNVQEVTFEDVNSILSSGDGIVIDVRSDEELKRDGRIPGFEHVPMPELKSALSLPREEFRRKYGFDLPDKNTLLVFSCQSGIRATAAAKMAIEDGYTNVRVYKGSFRDWVAKGGKVVKD